MRRKELRDKIIKKDIDHNMADVIAQAFLKHGIECVIDKYRPVLREVLAEVSSVGVEGKSKKYRTICEIHRLLYKMLIDAGYDEESEVIKLVREGFFYGKKMGYKLRQYKFNYDNEWYGRQKKESKVELDNDVPFGEVLD